MDKQEIMKIVINVIQKNITMCEEKIQEYTNNDTIMEAIDRISNNTNTVDDIIESYKILNEIDTYNKIIMVLSNIVLDIHEKLT